MLSENKDLLDTMARLLVERETIFSEEINMLMEGKSLEESIAFGSKAASIACTRRGAQQSVPTRAEVTEYAAD